MFNFVQDFIYFILSLQEKLLRKKLKRNLKLTYTNSTSKKVFGDSATLNLTVQTEINKDKAKNNIKVILKKCENDPQKLLEFVEKRGTKVYKIPFANKFLKAIGYEEGFISEINGIKALYVNVLLLIFGQKAHLSFASKPMFIVKTSSLEGCHIIQQFYKWYSMKLDLPGFDAESQKHFNSFLSSASDAKLSELSVEEMLGLKEAIARDIEAINFVVEMAKNTDGSKNALKKMKTGGASV